MDGYSSPMRRASELPFVSEIHQIGIRSFGSAYQSDIDDAQSWGRIYIMPEQSMKKAFNLSSIHYLLGAIFLLLLMSMGSIPQLCRERLP